MRLFTLFVATFLLLKLSPLLVFGQEFDSLGYPIPPAQRLYFSVSISNLTGFGGGLEFQFSKRWLAGGVLGARSMDWMRPVYRGNQINMRLYGGYSFSKTTLLGGFYAGTFDFGENVEAATLYSFSLGVRTSLDPAQVWFVELGTTPLMPSEVVRSNVRIRSHNPPPFIFLTVTKRFRDKQPEPDPLDNPYAYPPVMY